MKPIQTNPSDANSCKCWLTL